MSARFEVVRTAHEQWHARFVSSNGRIVWWTENYKRKVGAEKAISAIAIGFDYGAYPTIANGGVHALRISHGGHGQNVEVRYVDDRLTPMPSVGAP